MNRFDSIFVDVLLPLYQEIINLAGSIIPVSDSAYDLGSPENRFRNVYCNNVVQGNSALDSIDTIWARLEGSENAAIPLKFRYLTKSLGLVSYSENDESQPPSGYVRGDTIDFASAEDSTKLTLLNALWSRWEPIDQGAGAIIVQIDSSDHPCGLFWDSDNNLDISFMGAAGMIVKFNNGFNMVYELKNPIN